MILAQAAWGASFLTGTVSEQDGSDAVPLPGAYVQVKAGSPERVVAQAATDSRGRYLIEDVPEGRVTLGVVAEGCYTIKAGGLDSETITRTCPPQGECGSVDFLAARAGVLEGYLSDDFGAPVQGVEVTLTPASGAPPPPRGPGRAVRRTAVPGRYRLMAFGPKGAYLEGIEIDGRPVRGSKLTVPRSGMSGDVVVTMSFAAGTVRGTVREPQDGESSAAFLAGGGLLPPAGTVWLLPAGEDPPSRRRLLGRVREGGFEITAVPPGEYEAFAFPDRAGYSIEDPRYRKKLARYGGKVEVKSGETAVLDLQALPTREQFDREGLR